MSNPKTTDENAILKQTVLHIEKAFILLCESCERQANNFNSKSVPVDYVKMAANTIVTSYNKGLPKQKFSDKVRKMNVKG